MAIIWPTAALKTLTGELIRQAAVSFIKPSPSLVLLYCILYTTYHEQKEQVSHCPDGVVQRVVYLV
jgi:hypothetical protein